MFCQHCGTEANVDLNYCKRCGGNLGGVAALTTAPEMRPAITTGTACAVGLSMLLLVVMGLGLLLAFISEMRGSGLPPDVFKMIVTFGAFTILGGVASLTWLWTYLLGGARRLPTTPQLKAPPAAGELGPARVGGALPERPPASVVEHTTRTLEHSRR
ncbi:MAG TPA: hypothetical protein VF064_06990 [Pyrinomonadaceae bacterium]